MDQHKLTPEEKATLATLVFHLPWGATEPEWCEDPASCSTGGEHVVGIEAAEQMRGHRDSAAAKLLPSFTKRDLPLLGESERTGRSIFELRQEGW
ncbi:hypothetical protein ACWIDW_04935 [Microbacterium sp. NPDC055312]